MGMDNYYYPVGTPATEQSIQRVWDQLTNNAQGQPTTVQVAQGRTLMVERAAKRVAEVTFKDMCEKAKGSTDYMALAQNFQSIIIRGVPQLSMDRRDLLRRFILLIDQLYYHNRKVIIEAEKDLDNLFQKPKDKTEFDEEFAFERCLSRLKEMQTREYQEKGLVQDQA